MKLSVMLASLFGLASGNFAFADNPDFKAAHGTVLIAAPTALNGPTNQGLWFVNPQTKEFTLVLPPLPANEVYAGWLVDQCTGKKFSTGIFRSTGGIDSDAAGIFSGPLALNFPAQPGSDFVRSGENLADGSHDIVITVEPYPTLDSATPSGTAVLRANIPANVSVGTILPLVNVAQ